MKKVLLSLVLSLVVAASLVIHISIPTNATPAQSCNPGITAGADHTVALSADGTVVATGEDNEGSVSGMSSWTGIIQIAAGDGFTVGLMSDGNVDTTSATNGGDVSSWTNITQVAAGNAFTVGIKSDGTVVAAGNNDNGQLNVTSWAGIVQIAAGDNFTVGLESDGTVVTTSATNGGDVSSWTNIIQVAAGDEFTVGLESNGTVVGVGNDSHGQVSGLSSWAGITQVAAGQGHIVGLSPDGTVIAAGDNSANQCNIGSWMNIVQVTAGGDITVGLEADGTVVAVGDNTFGQCDTSSWNLGFSGPKGISVINIGGNSTPAAVAVNSNTNFIYSANNINNTISVIDGSNNSVVSTLTAGVSPWDVAVNPNTNMIYVANAGSSNVSVIDGSTQSVVATVPVGPDPISVAVNPVTNLIYTANHYDDTVSVINGLTNAVVNTIAIDSNNWCLWDVAVDPITNCIYVANFWGATVAVINGSTNTVVDTLDLQADPRDIVVNPVTNLIYVANMDGTVWVFDGSNNRLVTTVDVGTSQQSWGIFVDVNPLTNRIYVTNSVPFNGSWIAAISVIDGSTNNVVDTVNVGYSQRGASGVAVNPRTDRIYVNGLDNNIVSLFQDGVGSTASATSTQNGGASVVQDDGVAVNITGASTNADNTTVSIDSVNYGNISPGETGAINLDATQYYDVSISPNSNLGSAATAEITITSPAITANSTIQYWYDSEWNTAQNILINSSASPPTISGEVPVSYLTGTPFVIGATTASTSTSVTSSANPSVYGQAITFTAKVSPSTATGTVQFNVDGKTFGKPVIISGGSANIGSISTLSVGNHSVNAVYSGDNNDTTSTGTLSGGQIVNQASSSTSVSSSVNTSVFGQLITFTATVSTVSPGVGTPTGTVQFKDGTNNLGSAITLSGGEATYSTSSLSLGSHLVTAVYNGDANFTPSTSSALTQTVNQASTSTSIGSSANPSVFGQSVTFTVTVNAVAPGAGTPTGTVQFVLDGNNFGSPVSIAGGSATSSAIPTLSVSTHKVSAVYSGDTNFTTSTGTLSGGQVVNKATSSTVGANTTSTYSGSNQAVALSAAVTAVGETVNEGTVTFTVQNKNNTVIGKPVTSGTVNSGSANASLYTPWWYASWYLHYNRNL